MEFPQVIKKILILGKTESGKTSLMLRFTEDLFYSKYVKTIAVDCKTKICTIADNFIRMSVFDAPGDEDLAALVPTYWNTADAIIFVVYDSESLQWLTGIQERVFKNSFLERTNPLRALVVSKTDLGFELNHQELVKFAEENSMKLYYCSAKTGENVQETFEDLAKALIFNNSAAEESSTVKTTFKEKLKNKCCLL